MKSLSVTAAAAALAVSLVVAATPSKAAVTSYLNQSSPVLLPDSSTVSFSPSPADQIKFYDPANNSFAAQDPDKIQTGIETSFGLSSGSLLLVSFCDAATCTDASQTGSGAKSGSFSSDYKFNYLAVHFGNKELVFYYDDPISMLEISGLKNGLSNWRAYTDEKTPAVPVPAAIPLFLSGLAGLGLVSRRRKAS